jgi:hypothetical protein
MQRERVGLESDFPARPAGGGFRISDFRLVSFGIFNICNYWSNPLTKFISLIILWLFSCIPGFLIVVSFIIHHKNKEK